MPYTKDHKANSRDRILTSAIDLFSRYGFEKVSISQIMRDAKMTHGAFYSHFESKEALFQASFLETIKRSRAARLVKGPLSIPHLTNLVKHYWNLRELEKNNRPGPEVLLFNEAGNQNAQVRKLFEESYENLKKMVETRLLALCKLKVLKLDAGRENIAEQSRAILSLLIGAVVVAKTITRDEEQQKIQQAAQKQILQILGVNMGELSGSH